MTKKKTNELTDAQTNYMIGLVCEDYFASDEKPKGSVSQYFGHGGVPLQKFYAESIMGEQRKTFHMHIGPNGIEALKLVHDGDMQGLFFHYNDDGSLNVDRIRGEHAPESINGYMVTNTQIKDFNPRSIEERQKLIEYTEKLLIARDFVYERLQPLPLRMVSDFTNAVKKHVLPKPPISGIPGLPRP